MAGDGAVKFCTGWPLRESRRVCATESIGFCDCPSPTALNGLSGSAMKLAAASSFVKPTNQADRVLSVVPVLPPTGRPTICVTIGAVDHSWQEPVCALPPVGQRAASAAARATSGVTSCRQRGLATSTVCPDGLVQVTCL